MENKRTSPLFVIIMAGLAAFGPLSIDMYLPALPEVKNTFGTTTAITQLTLTLFMVGLAVGNIVAGTVSDSTGRKKPLIISLISYVIASIVIALAPNVIVMIVFRFIQGVSGGAGIVLSRAIATDLYKGRALTQFLALLMLVNGAAPVLAPMFGGFILSLANYRVLFWILTILSLLMLVGALFKIDETLPQASRRPAHVKAIAEDFKILLTRRSFILPILIQGFTYAMFFSYMAASPFIMQNLYGLTAQQYSYIFALTGLGLIVTAQLTGRIVKYVNQHALFRTFSFIQLAGAILAIFSLMNHWSLWILLPAFLLIMAPVAGIATLAFAIAVEGQKKGIGSASSLVGLLQYFIGGISTPLVGLQGEYSYVPYIFVVIVTMTVIMLLQFYHYWANTRHESQANVE
ncbi:multidrug effflux MFS transporter [Staphylococcus cornubiensis]|uniref:multidrug effflux MFS transporter n=1 Tax=Staphylococcus cornubiensis TaxID=1986155 RepID=UPI000A3B150D|nr:multidrug effflux MFS transporter [Staphylococcus cornubiensis]